MKCLILTLDSTKNNYQALGGEPIFEKTRSGYVIRNEGIQMLTHYIITENRSIHSEPLVDETNFKGNVDFDLNTELSNILELNKELGKYGFALKEGDRKVEVLVLKKSKLF
jgi:hypothetical protein